jgi:MFS family permease
MVGTGETYLAAFALALGLGEVAAGLITTLPLLMGASLQLLAPRGMQCFGSPRRWVVFCAAMQATCFLALVALALTDRLPNWTVFPLAAWYWCAGFSTSGAWNTWIGMLIPAALRPQVFALRTRLAQFALLCGFVAGGIALQLGHQWGDELRVFALLFLVAAACRYLSALFLWQQSDVMLLASGQRQVPIGQWFQRLGTTNEGKMLAYLLAIQCSVHISGAYFTPYMLKHLNFSYAEYMIVVASAFASKSLFAPLMGRLAARWGTRRLLWWGGIGIVPLSALWLVSNSFAYLVALQIVGAFAWAGYELAMALLFIEIREEERTSVLTTFNFAWSAATVGGSLIGAGLLTLGGKTATAYLTIFAISGVARVFALTILRQVPEVAVAPVAMSRSVNKQLEVATQLPAEPVIVRDIPDTVAA